MRKSVAAIVMVGAFCVSECAQAGHIRVVVSPWRIRPIVVAPRVVVAAAPVAPVGKGFIDLSVTPMDAQVWIDGEYVGLASHYSGDPSYLKLASGSHTVHLGREGYTPQRYSVVVEPNRLITLDVMLVPLSATPAAAPQPVAAPVDGTAPAPAPAPVAAEEPPTYQLDLDKTGYLALTVAPADACLYIDDEPYGVVAEYNGDESIVLRAGPHKVQVIRPGYISNVQTVEIVSDTTQNVSVTLTKE